MNHGTNEWFPRCARAYSVMFTSLALSRQIGIARSGSKRGTNLLMELVSAFWPSPDPSLSAAPDVPTNRVGNADARQRQRPAPPRILASEISAIVVPEQYSSTMNKETALTSGWHVKFTPDLPISTQFRSLAIRRESTCRWDHYDRCRTSEMYSGPFAGYCVLRGIAILATKAERWVEHGY
jgi:hypothetical protein